jgi:hypothetical protein
VIVGEKKDSANLTREMRKNASTSFFKAGFIYEKSPLNLKTFPARKISIQGASK